MLLPTLLNKHTLLLGPTHSHLHTFHTSVQRQWRDSIKEKGPLVPSAHPALRLRGTNEVLWDKVGSPVWDLGLGRTFSCSSSLGRKELIRNLPEKKA